MNNILQHIEITAKKFRETNLSSSHKLFSQELGETVAEKNLAKLLRKKFSNYITFVNPYAEKGKELGDAIVILKNKVLIFSDKSAESWSNPENFKSLEELSKKWENFYQGVKKSETQLKNAKYWMLNNINNKKLDFFLDKKCTMKIQFELDKNTEFFLITTVSGLKNTANKFLNEEVLPIDQRKKIQSNKKILSTINKFEEEHFYNTFDIVSLEKILDYLDTPVDFISYLKFRYDFFKNNTDFKLEREEQILFLYIIKDMEGNIQYEENITEVEFLNIDKKIIEKLRGIPLYDDRVKYGKQSSVIDDLIDIITYQDNHDIINNIDIEHRKKVSQWLYLNRRERIALFLDLEDLIEDSKKNKNKSVKSVKMFNGKYLMVYLFYRWDKLSDEEYLKHRRENAKKQIEDFKSKVDHPQPEMFFIYTDHPSCKLTTTIDFYE